MKKTYMIPQAQVIDLRLDMCLLSGSRTMLHLCSDNEKLKGTRL